ncbi:MAG: hypothetical protein ABSH19_08795 [Opitutales bacterium]|jgi:hypothetical protein
MTQEPNTSSDSSPRPRLLQPRAKPPAPPAAPPAPAPEPSAPPPIAPAAPDPAPPEPTSTAAPAAAPSAVPRLSFSPKKRVEETPPAPAPPASEAPAPAKLGLRRAGPPAEAPASSISAPALSPEAASPNPEAPPAPTQLKRPPPGVRLVPSQEIASDLPPPLTPVPSVTPAAAAAVPVKRFSWARLAIYGFLFILLISLGSESVYILFFNNDEAPAAPGKPANPISYPSNLPASTSKPIDVQASAGPNQPAAAAFLLPLNIPVASGSSPRIWVNGQIYHLGDVISPEYGLRWTHLDDQTEQLEFTDKTGQRYIKKF